MNLLNITIVTIYFATLALLALYGVHRLYLVLLYHRHHRRQVTPLACFKSLPFLTVQLPIYNELYVAERLIKACCALDYPRDRLQIQVLDDSDDETSALCRAAVEKHRSLGVQIEYWHRPSREGFKAGALARGLSQARGEFIAIFDADFIPNPDFARRMIDYFTDPSLGMVQARWGHINRNYSALTRVQSILLDGHFVIEQTARNRTGKFFNFNGTAGIWRRACIDTAGGWQFDTLTEDLDLSYRAQLAGWRFLFLPDVVAPAELPVEMNAFKSQQHRWTKGSIQTCLKLLPRILRSPIRLGVKAEAFVHLTSNLAYVLMALFSILLYPAILARETLPWRKLLLLDLPILGLATGSVLLFYLLAQRAVQSSWKNAILTLPVLMAVGIGLCVNNTRAVLEALTGKPTDFVRTPKYRIEQKRKPWWGKSYEATLSLTTLVEVMLGAYCLVVLYYALIHGIYSAVPFLLLFLAGYFYTPFLSLSQVLRAFFHRARPASP